MLDEGRVEVAVLIKTRSWVQRDDGRNDCGCCGLEDSGVGG